MDDLRGGVRLKRPKELIPDESVSAVFDYHNRDREAFHHLKNVSLWPTWNPHQKVTISDISVLPNDSKRLLTTDVDTPLGLSGRQGFHVESEVGSPTENGEMEYHHYNTVTPLAVPVVGTVQYDAVLYTAGAGDPNRSVRDFIQNWGFNMYLASAEQEVREQLTEFANKPACFVGVIPVDSNKQGRQTISSAVSVALSWDIPALVLVEDGLTQTNLPESGDCFIIKCNIKSQQALARHCGPELLGLRRSMKAGTTDRLLEQVRERAKQEPSEFLRALVYSVLLEQSGATERVLDVLDDPIELFVSPTVGSTLKTNDSTWPTFQANTARTGHHPTASGPQTSANIRWTFQLDDNISSPVVADGTVYIGSEDNHLYAVEADTGTELWQFKTDQWVVSSPAVADGTVFFGSHDANVYALEAATGRQQWIFQTDDKVVSSPAITDGTLYITTTGGSVYALETATGRQQCAFQLEDRLSPEGLAEANGSIYIGSREGNVSAFEATTGRQQWTFQTNGLIYSSPTIAGDTVYIGDTDGVVYALEAATGRQQWTFQTEGHVYYSPAVAHDTVYIGGSQKKVNAVEAATGRQQWAFRTNGGHAWSSLVIADGTVYFGATDETVYAFDAATGRQRWAVQADHLIHLPAVANNSIYLGGDDGVLYALTEPTK
jgi:outer membrane protein assembly factor BamB